MSNPIPNDWRELCLKVVGGLEPEQRIAILEELGHMLRNDRRKDIHRFGHLCIDFGRGQVIRNGQPVYLTNLEFKLLRHFIERAGRPVSRDELLRSVWGYKNGAFTRTVDMHVHGLRQKLERDPKRPELIVTVKGDGYKFVGSESEG